MQNQDTLYPQALLPGTVLSGQYIIEKVLAQGGFGITYKASDHKTGSIVAIKEFFPTGVVSRNTAISDSQLSASVALTDSKTEN